MVIFQCIIGDKLKEIEKLIREFGFPNGINKFYAFKYGKISKKQNGWKVYDYFKEMRRQGVEEYTFDSSKESKPKPAHAYQLVNNKNF